MGFSHGCPATVKTNGEAQLEPQLLRGTLRILGCHRSHTPAYHPVANGMVQRFHRQLKASLATSDGSNWMKPFPTAFLGLRSAFESNIGASAAEFVYPRTLPLLRLSSL